jgi:hypothetical protein
MVGEEEQAVQRKAMVTSVAKPQFSAVNFWIYIEEVGLWREVCHLPGLWRELCHLAGLWREVYHLPEKQGIMLWLALPREHPSNIKELIMAKIGRTAAY